MHRALDAGRVVQSAPGRVPRYKRYLDKQPGAALDDVWTDISPVQSRAKERVGYPTQKPLALLDRIIKASSNPGDGVLDPFCGCATACVSAESLGRQWIGIDLSPVAATLVESRLREQFGIFAEIHHRTLVTAPSSDRPSRSVPLCHGSCSLSSRSSPRALRRRGPAATPEDLPTLQPPVRHLRRV